MFLIVDKLNEGKVTATKVKRIKTVHSEGKSPRSIICATKDQDWKSTKSQSCVNSNWQKLRV